MTLIPSTERPQTNRLATWVSSSSQSRSLGVLQAGTYVARAHVHVTQAFNSDGSDTITVGYDTDTDAFITSVDVSTTGIKSVTLGALAGYNATARQVKAYYVNGGSEPSLGKALIILEIFPVPPSP